MLLRKTGWRNGIAKETIKSMIEEFSDQSSIDPPCTHLSIMELFIMFYRVLERQEKTRKYTFDDNYTRSVIANMLMLEPAIEIGLLDWLEDHQAEKDGDVFVEFRSIVEHLGTEIFNAREEVAYYTRLEYVS